MGEALTLPVDCLISEQVGGQLRWGVHFHKEKSRGGAKQLAVRWLTPNQAVLVRAAVEEATAITSPARARARVLEAHDDTVPLPGNCEGELVAAADLESRLGLKRSQIKGIRRVDRQRRFYRASDIRRRLMAIRAPELWVIDRGDGTRQQFSESLFVTFRRFLAPDHRTNPLLVEPVTEQHLNDFLGGREQKGRFNIMSAFARFGLKARDGGFFTMHTHQLRHWLTNEAAIAGAPDAVIARWQGREHLGELAAYKHMTIEQRVEVMKRAIKGGSIKGPVAQIYFSLNDDVRDAFLEGQLQAVHVTSLVCTHDFNVETCRRVLVCATGCSDYLFDPGNPEQRSNLEQLRHRLKWALEQAEAAFACDGSALAQSWVHETQLRLAGIERILTTEKAGSDAPVRPFAGCSSKFEPVRKGRRGTPED